MQLNLKINSDPLNRWNAAQIIAFGLFGGFSLGVIARLWMRWITTDPEFTWSGTLGIVIGFTLFGTAHSLLYYFKRPAQTKQYQDGCT